MTKYGGRFFLRMILRHNHTIYLLFWLSKKLVLALAIQTLRTKKKRELHSKFDITFNVRIFAPFSSRRLYRWGIVMFSKSHNEINDKNDEKNGGKDHSHRDKRRGGEIRK